MKIYKKISFLIIIALFGLIYVSIGNSYEDNVYLTYGDHTFYGVEMIIGDKLTWSFETYAEEFEVYFEIFWLEGNSSVFILVSDGLTLDSGVWYAPHTDTFYMLFINLDTFHDGFISIYFEVNVEPTPPDENPFPFGIIVILVIVIAISILTVGILVSKRRTSREVKIPYKKEEKLKKKISELETKGVEPIFQPSPSISERSKEKLIPEMLDLKVEKIQPVPLIKEEREESKITEDSLTKIKEKQPVPPVLDTKEEKPKVIPHFCKFCGIELNKKATFCPQCGTRIKKK